MTASRTSPSRSQRMMGMTWRTLSSTRTEKAGSSSWVSLSWACLPNPSASINAVAWFYCCALLCFPKRRIKNITSNVFGAFRDWLSFCMACSVISRALNAFKSSSVSLCFCWLWSLYLFWLLLCLTCDFSAGAGAGAVHPSGGTYSPLVEKDVWDWCWMMLLVIEMHRSTDDSTSHGSIH